MAILKLLVLEDNSELRGRFPPWDGGWGRGWFGWFGWLGKLLTTKEELGSGEVAGDLQGSGGLYLGIPGEWVLGGKEGLQLLEWLAGMLWLLLCKAGLEGKEGAWGEGWWV